jgi:adenosine deaminase
MNLSRLSEAILSAALASPDPQALRDLGKSDVHCHGLLNAPLSAYEAVLGHPLPPPPIVFRDFSEFGGYLAANLFPALQRLDHVRTLLSAGLERMVDEGVVYAEVSLDLLLPEHLGVPPQVVAEMVAEVKARFRPRLRFAPEIGINRRQPVDRLRPFFDAYLASGVFESVDLYDDERAGDLREVQPFYRRARDAGLALKAHAGEICGPDRIRETLTVLEVDALQHGISAVHDPALLEELARRGTRLNVAVSSNVRLGLVGGYERHPIRRLLKAGVDVALGTDDFTMFGSGLCDELRRLHRAGLKPSELAKIWLGPPLVDGAG